MTYIIYSKTGCDYCDRAKKLLMGHSVVEINCDQLIKQDRNEFVRSMEQKMNMKFKSFPMIFDGETNLYIGGYNDLIEYMSFELLDEF